MLTLKRVNKMGQSYTLVEGFGPEIQTEVRVDNKKMVMPYDIHLFDQGWYQWMKGELVQRAFPFLTAGEREFLMTGITPEEWAEMWKEKDGQ